MPNQSVRIWDLPTRLFHWALALCVVALVVSAKMNAMDWHFRFGYSVLALLAFRLVWGIFGGYWSRFTSFLHTPGQFARHISGKEDHSTGHSPLGALSVFALLLVLILQVASGLMSDDEISVSGPLTRFVSGEWVSTATWWHAKIGQYLIYVLVGLHVLAIVLYAVRGKKLVGPMITGDKQLPATVRPSRDNAGTRFAGLLVLAACTGLAWWVSTLGSF
ncbi:cytochrome b/b6 domain-containing protein [Diaphorobacter aerolatus]|uniref:Cytochrome b/b6 domain-containing protein n=1 Tax=Diaphorobacter aerolatus TaxID=1288495 RepID=A0A7H0GFM4_9BURK|nr:cytochrome b/b6 domain-containing protein [Diaphorobacter aerolatus]QNP47090.1 cytochrome b/b6 domain-containing protein [Diaphorobacter aerolatus]